MIHFDMKLEDFKGKEGFNPDRDKECRDHNQELVVRSKKKFLSAKEYNKGKPITPPNEYFSADEVNFREFNSTLI